MANELDKTIEELEAEVMAELEEANGADAPKKSAVPAETVGKAKSNPEDASMQDTGAAVVSPSQGDAPAKKVAGAAKEVSGDQNKRVKVNQMQWIRQKRQGKINLSQLVMNQKVKKIFLKWNMKCHMR